MITPARNSPEPRRSPSLTSSQQNTSCQTSVSVNELGEQVGTHQCQSVGGGGGGRVVHVCISVLGRENEPQG